MWALRTELGIGLIVVGAGTLLLIALTGAAAAGVSGQVAAAASALVACAGGAGLAWKDHRLTMRIEELRGWVNLVAGQPNMARREVTPDADAIDRVQLAILDMIGMRLDQQSATYRRLEGILNALPDGVVVVTQEGLISLVNAQGRRLFDHQGSVVGTSAFETLSRQSLSEALGKARAAGKPVTTDIYNVRSVQLPVTVSLIDDEGGALLRFPAGDAVARGGEHDLSLHDRPAPPEQVVSGMPLANLPALAIDTETTGLDTRRDRVISIGAVRLHGARLYRAATVNLLVNPGCAIPNRTIAVHGISNSMVADAPPFKAVADEIGAATEHLVLVGHHVAFDIQMLRNEMSASGRDWSPAHSLDVMLLYSGLFPDATSLLLDDIAAALEVPVIGRHSALGDALTTGEIYVRLVPVLIGRGVDTLAAAEAFQAKAAQRLGRPVAWRTGSEYP